MEDFGHLLPTSLIKFDLGTYDIILGMDFLGNHSAEILCRERMVRVKSLKGEQLIRGKMILTMQALSMLREGDKGILCYISSSEEKGKASV